jgi:integrase
MLLSGGCQPGSPGEILVASLTQDPDSKIWHIHFRLYGRQFHRSLNTTDEKEARAEKGRIELTLLDITVRKRQVIPLDADPWVFIRSDGKLNQKPTASKVYTLRNLFEAYFEQQTAGSKEENTLKTERIHKDHLLRILGGAKALNTFAGADVQTYINERATRKWRGKKIQPETIKKEVNTLQMVWNRAEKLLGVTLPGSLFEDLTFPKAKEKPSFQTWQEIEQTIDRGNLEKDRQRELWDSLFLDNEQVEELLDYARDKKTRSAYVYPLLVFAAHTGARLSEIMRSRMEDLKFDVKQVVLREKKKSQTSETYRRVPMSRRFREVLLEYFHHGHPGGVYTISREPNQPMGESTLHEAHEWFFRGSKWEVLRGYHVLRHSFASNLARLGIDQRVIDELMGHQTEAMRKRYRHLFPEQTQNAIQRLFD